MYITRRQCGPVEVLVFDHVGIPEAGIKVPAGSVEAGEDPERAVLREAFEETGLMDLTVTRKVGLFTYVDHQRQEVHERHVFQVAAAQPLPESWVHEVSGGESDKGLVFRCYWLNARVAASVLERDQGSYLQRILD